MELPPNMSIAARLTRSSWVNAEPSSSLEAMIVPSESFRAPGFTFFSYSRMDKSQIYVLLMNLKNNTSINSSLDRLHASPFHGIRLMILKTVGKKVANA
jgi:hypothetical protein